MFYFSILFYCVIYRNILGVVLLVFLCFKIIYVFRGRIGLRVIFVINVFFLIGFRFIYLEIKLNIIY